MEEEQAQVSSTWPPPPPFWQDFQPESMARIDELRRDRAQRDDNSNPAGGIDPSSGMARRLEGLPRELRNLQPPPEPADGEWRVFGDKYKLVDELPKLEDMQIRRLFPNPEERDQDGKHFDRVLILKRLAKSLLLNFLELTDLLADHPEAAEEKITDIRDLFINFHHLINEYRPHQARESLISMMQAQLDRKRAETNAIRDATDKTLRIMEGLGSLVVQDVSNGMTPEAEDTWSDELETWEFLASEA
ncbi:mediator complex, subunit Med7 [Xylariaceae sp. FL0804]|nr:mediator complex, subunit Med7 [Xylariaceae sp. FL0804]